jgi:hypothetical protein
MTFASAAFPQSGACAIREAARRALHVCRATDGMHFRVLGVPAYGVSRLFMKSSDGYAHGLTERVPIVVVLATLSAQKSF